RDWLLSKLEDLSADFFSRFELHRRPFGDGDIRFGGIWISTDAGPAHFYFEDAEIAQLDLVPGGEGGGDAIQRLLHHRENILLNDSGVAADAHHKVTLG